MSPLKFIFPLLLLSPLLSRGDNLQLLDQGGNGFAIYRSGAPSLDDFKEWCRLGISEVMVLSGNAERYESTFLDYCPSIRVIYNVMQSSHVPVNAGFMRKFMKWVEGARVSGKRVLFRCNCGCNRTGRLAAFYEMKYKGASYEGAIRNMMQFGSNLSVYPDLDEQVIAMHDFSLGRQCTTEPAYCVRD